MHLDSDGKKILTELLNNRFVAPQETWYDPIRQMNLSLSLSEETAHANAKSKE
jgi:hypothetical protein